MILKVYQIQSKSGELRHSKGLLLHKGTKQNEETAQESRENFCKSYIQKVVNVQNIRGTYTTQYTLRRKKKQKWRKIVFQRRSINGQQKGPENANENHSDVGYGSTHL